MVPLYTDTDVNDILAKEAKILNPQVLKIEHVEEIGQSFKFVDGKIVELSYGSTVRDLNNLEVSARIGDKVAGLSSSLSSGVPEHDSDSVAVAKKMGIALRELLKDEDMKDMLDNLQREQNEICDIYLASFRHYDEQVKQGKSYSDESYKEAAVNVTKSLNSLGFNAPVDNIISSMNGRSSGEISKSISKLNALQAEMGIPGLVSSEDNINMVKKIYSVRRDLHKESDKFSSIISKTVSQDPEAVRNFKYCSKVLESMEKTKERIYANAFKSKLQIDSETVVDLLKKMEKASAENDLFVKNCFEQFKKNSLPLDMSSIYKLPDHKKLSEQHFNNVERVWSLCESVKIARKTMSDNGRIAELGLFGIKNSNISGYLKKLDSKMKVQENKFLSDPVYGSDYASVLYQEDGQLVVSSLSAGNTMSYGLSRDSNGTVKHLSGDNQKSVDNSISFGSKLSYNMFSSREEALAFMGYVAKDCRNRTNCDVKTHQLGQVIDGYHAKLSSIPCSREQVVDFMNKIIDKEPQRVGDVGKLLQNFNSERMPVEVVYENSRSARNSFVRS